MCLCETSQWAKGRVWNGGGWNSQISDPEIAFPGLKFPVESLVLLAIRRIPQKFQTLKFQSSGPEIWRIHPPPFHTPPFACLTKQQGRGGIAPFWGAANVPEEVSRDMGCRSDSIATSRDIWLETAYG